MDLTTLSEDDTAGRVRRLCAKARHPVREDLLDAMGIAPERIRVAAVCVYPRFVRTAVEALEGSSIPVATVSAGFPRGLGPTDEVLDQIAASVAAGAAEIDVVITREHVLSHRWDALYDEVRSFRDACGDALIKAILATGELGTLDNVARASQVCMMAGADFIKTSTGRERVNATLPVGITMARAIRAYAERTGHAVGLKPAGGIRSANDALHWLTMVEEELGAEWLSPERFRFGASSLLDDIEQRLEAA
jgi:deoxyribose-phosphate aldolase